MGDLFDRASTGYDRIQVSSRNPDPEDRTRVSAIILAGGQSRRMGRDKAFIEFKGVPLIAHVIERVRHVSNDVLIVANDADAFVRFGLPVVADVYPGKGSLGGIFSGL